jgi:hypothetical protein
MEAVAMEAVAMESSAEPTTEPAAVEAIGRNRHGEGEWEHSHEQQTEDLLHNRLLLTSTHLK